MLQPSRRAHGATPRKPRPPMPRNPLPEAVFRHQLAKFSVVRSSDYVGAENLPQRKRVQVIKDTVAPTVDEESAYAQSHEATEFWAALKTFLCAHYSPADAKRLQNEFEKVHFEFLDRLCIEDVEDLATAFDDTC